ncbi:MAG: exosortase O, partial [Okeania sp. SIO3B3]|nr:exosortase O [Okeania sp. SIO3B3]
MLLLAGALPINSHIETFVGYPLRVSTATIVRDGLALFGVGSIGIDTILVLENGLTHVDAPCSGVNSLWTGSMFLLATTWIEGKRLSGSWVGIVILLLISLIIANVLRVAVLVLTGTVWNLPLIADMLHLPLGMLGFIGCCVLTLLLLRQLPTPTPSLDDTIKTSATRWLPLALTGLCLILALTYHSSVRDAVLQPAPDWPFTATFHTTPDPLEDEVWAWLVQDGAKTAERLSFRYGDLSGSLLFVISDNWHAHHNPERCFLGGGLTTVSSDTLLLEASFPVRRVQLTTPSGDLRSAVYWYQSQSLTTDDYATRIWADVRLQREEWILVTILFDTPVDWQAVETQQMLRDLHKTIQLAP